jgi:hypothetical protein
VVHDRKSYFPKLAVAVIAEAGDVVTVHGALWVVKRRDAMTLSVMGLALKMPFPPPTSKVARKAVVPLMLIDGKLSLNGPVVPTTLVGAPVRAREDEHFRYRSSLGTPRCPYCHIDQMQNTITGRKLISNLIPKPVVRVHNRAKVANDLLAIDVLQTIVIDKGQHHQNLLGRSLPVTKPQFIRVRVSIRSETPPPVTR